MAINIAFKYFAYSLTPETSRIYVMTDVNSHIFLFLSYFAVSYKYISVVCRGNTIRKKIKTYIPRSATLEEDASGDHRLHYFTLYLQPLVFSYHLYFYGYVSGVFSPSTSPVYEIIVPL